MDATVSLDIYDVAGEPVWSTQVAGWAGKNLLAWLGENGMGGRCASGVYVLRFRARGVDGTEEQFWEQAVISR